MRDTPMISNRDRRKRKWATRRYELKANLDALGFITVFLTYWLFYVLFMGWYLYLFKPETYLIRAGDILEDIELSSSGKTKAHRFWWSRINCNAARTAVASNDINAIVRFTLRVHPFYLDNEILTVRSKGFNTRVWKDDSGL